MTSVKKATAEHALKHFEAQLEDAKMTILFSQTMIDKLTEELKQYPEEVKEIGITK